MSIRILITGGTFDKEYNELTGQLFFKETHLPEMLKLGRCSVDLEVETLFMMDSLDMQDEHRKVIADRCLNTKESRIVITHGTDTMAETGQFLSTLVTKKTIVLTGAMVPYKFGSSDGFFNLGSALAFVQTLPHGVYLAMNGKHFRAGQVKKNKQRGLFEPLK
jgi:L-asparaginase